MATAADPADISKYVSKAQRLKNVGGRVATSCALEGSREKGYGRM
jgi:hypothetical protein